MTTHCQRRRAFRPAFTMIEIAIALGVIAFALVAIIGVLPFGLNVQKESHQDTVISQDAPFFLSAIADGAPTGTNLFTTNFTLDFLTNYVESIAIISTVGNNRTTNFPTINTGKEILGALTTPAYYPVFSSFPTQQNIVVAHIRSLSGNALEQGGANSVVAFRYLMYVETVPFDTGTEQHEAFGFGDNPYLGSDLYEVHLKFSWPIVGSPSSNNFAVGPGRANFRVTVSGQLQSVTNPPYVYWYVQPNAYVPVKTF